MAPMNGLIVAGSQNQAGEGREDDERHDARLQELEEITRRRFGEVDLAAAC
jgi:hypothetical protein